MRAPREAPARDESGRGGLGTRVGGGRTLKALPPTGELTLVDSESEGDYRRRFEEMSILELEDAWEEPMPELVRALLLAEIRRRNYRIESLPKPPPSATHTSLQPLSVSEQELPHAVLGVGIILVIAVLQLLTGALLAWDVIEEPPEFLPVSHILGAGSISGLGVAFLLLFLWARYDAYSALLAALTLFVAIHGIETFQLGITPSIGVELIVIVYLAIGIRSAARLESTERP